MGKNTYQVETEEQDVKEAMYEAITISSPPDACDNCQNMEGLYFTANKDKDGNIYINVKCPKCQARSGLGTLKAGGHFWKRFEVYVPKVEQSP